MVLATLYNPSNMKNLPCGEPYINQRTSDYSERFTFTGKGPRKGWRTPLSKVKYREQRDEETGYGYFGARYMDYELMAMWLSVDPLADKYPGTSPYAYCAWSPIIAKDPNGMDSVRTPNGMANAGTGYKTTPDGQYLYGEGLKTMSGRKIYKVPRIRCLESYSDGRISRYHHRIGICPVP